MQTPHRFRTKRQLWNYSGLGLETHDSAQYCIVEGQLRRSKKPQQLRGLNDNHNHDLKNIFKGAAMQASTSAGPFRDFYEALLAKGRRPTMARLTLARKIAAITPKGWRKDPLRQQWMPALCEQESTGKFWAQFIPLTIPSSCTFAVGSFANRKTLRMPRQKSS
jgi:hypothetical protein